jgi:transcriptional regulator with XRE-family HTH domain
MTRIRELRQEKGLRLIDLVFETRIHPTQLSYVERGKVAASARVKEKLCSFLGAKACDLFSDSGIAV